MITAKIYLDRVRKALSPDDVVTLDRHEYKEALEELHADIEGMIEAVEEEIENDDEEDDDEEDDDDDEDEVKED